MAIVSSGGFMVSETAVNLPVVSSGFVNFINGIPFEFINTDPMEWAN